jgi:hypothetical protein
MRTFVPCTVFLLAIYFALYLPFPWLHHFSMVHDFFEDSGETFDPRAWLDSLPLEMIVNLLIVLWFFRPWSRSRGVGIFLFVLSFVGLFWIPYLHILMEDDFPSKYFSSYAHFHPLITIPYFLISAAWSAGVGTCLGLRHRRLNLKSILLVLLFVPAVEWGVLHIVFITEMLDLYQEWMFLYAMLVFYMIPLGAFWMGLKWNLLIGLSRRDWISR